MNTCQFFLNMRNFLLVIGLFILFATEILRVYFIMPMPGSQEANTIDLAYFIGRNSWLLRIVGLLLATFGAVAVFRNKSRWKKIILIFFFLLYGFVVYLFNFVMEADKMFDQPRTKIFASGKENKVADSKLIIGISINGIAKAYPVQFIGYHHQVADSIGNTSVMVTYCTVCRTGRVFEPVVNGKKETFRLVGMDHFNAMFEDATTKSWWQQATGVAITGPLKGASLKEIPSQQMTLAAWKRSYPNTLVLQPDTDFAEQYKKMETFEKGLSKGKLTKRDSSSWQPKSWVIGIIHNQEAKAYDWNQLQEKRMIEDSLRNLPLLITIEKDNTSFHTWSRMVNGIPLRFKKSTEGYYLLDQQTGSIWNEDGQCISGSLSGNRLARVQSYQEFWHSWQNFHPQTKR